ncbi:hypothetical protein [Winogradskyella sp. MIT101101]|uniref:hypothetical protein n=1 Tax=Winogradskyella sp. MIT101101 TaxID=3098297 RepID=UPI00399A070A
MIALRATHLTGHILIQSETKIIVHQSSNLKDVLLIAPEIEIRDNVVGNFQAVATKKIVIGSNVQLNYPSALVISEKQKIVQEGGTNQISEQNAIVIDENSSIKGSVVYLGQEKHNNYKAQIELKENSTIYGELYCNQNVELQGNVYGTVYANNFIANQAGSIYQNHIYNGTIMVNELSQEYIGLMFNDSRKEILKWLY